MNKQFLRYLQISFQVLDILMLNATIMISKSLFGSRIPEDVVSGYFHYLIFLNISWLILAWFNGVYRENNFSSFESFSRQTKQLYILWLCSIMVYLFLYRMSFWILTRDSNQGFGKKKGFLLYDFGIREKFLHFFFSQQVKIWPCFFWPEFIKKCNDFDLYFSGH